MIETLITQFSNKNLVNLLRKQNSSFIEQEENLSEIVSSFDKFDELIKLGEIEYDNKDVLMVFTCQYLGELSSRSSKKAQYEIAKKALKEDFKDGAVFVFYDEVGRFRFSFIRRNYGDKSQKYTPWKRYTYFVDANQDRNRTFVERIGTCKFDSLDNIQDAFSVEKLTKEFYKELSDWYFWAIKNVSFPNDVKDDADDEKYNSENIIRLITRLVFVWFLKQKGLVKNELFDPAALSNILVAFEAESETQNNYYRAILQNLFFATLNQEIDKRSIAEDKGFVLNQNTYTIKNLYRYEIEFINGLDEIMELFSQVPFLNGGLFECLDHKEKDGKIYDWDGFSRNPKYQARIPNALFFAKESKVDLSGEYNDKKMKGVKVSGIIEILNRYNFTVEENTPVEIEVALDPELLGKVFENLLGAFNPETQETARKQTGSFYTPREIVNYMVDESLIAYFQSKIPEIQEEILRSLFSYDDETLEIAEEQKESLIQAAFDCKILDPACGSGAFPMGILQQMVHVLKKLDPDNSHWNNVVLTQTMKDFEKAEKLSDEDKDELRTEIEKTFDAGLNYPDYARKLHIIENCIYGVDIQSIAVQISKLRFFISLVCEQRRNTEADENFGIRPLPNLETKFVAANTLIGLEKTEEDLELFNDSHIKTLIDKLQHVRHRQFLVTNATEKKRLRDKDQVIREEIEKVVSELYKKHKDDNKAIYVSGKATLEKQLELIDKTINRTAVSTTIFGDQVEKTYNPLEKQKKNLQKKIDELTKNIEGAGEYTRLDAVVSLAKQLTAWNPYDQNASSPFFDPEWMFGLPNHRHGYFDVVIGNPPYGAKLTKDEKNIYKIKYPESQFKIDTYSLFILHSISILREMGFCSFIIPNTILDNYFEENVRRKLLLSNRIYELCDLNDKVFESAVVHAMIFSYFKDSSISDYNIKVNVSNNLYASSSLVSNRFFEKQDNCIFQLRSHGNNNFIDKLRIKSERLENVLDIRQAIKSGDDKLFLTDTQIDDNYKPILRGKDVFRYNFFSPNKFIYYGKHLACPRSKEIFEQPKILIREAGAIITATYDDSNFYIMSSLYNAISKDSGFDLKYLLGLINSKLFQYLMNQSTFEKTKGAFTKAKIYHWYSLPVKITDKQKIIIDLVDKILKFNKTGDAVNNDELEQRIDNFVYHLYELTYEEVKEIDPEIESKISEADYNAIEV